MTVLVGCSHGTHDPDGRRVVSHILDDVRAARPDLEVREAFVDVQEPCVADVVAGTADAVVVPLLLSSGYHVGVDIARAVEERGVAAHPLGPDTRLVDILMDRLAEVEVRPFDTVVVAAAGSSLPGAARSVEHIADSVRRRHRGHVLVGYGAMAQPPVTEAVALAKASLWRIPHPLGVVPRVVVASYLLAPGHFHDKLRASGADAVTRPLGPDPRLVNIVLDRYDAALTPAETSA